MANDPFVDGNKPRFEYDEIGAVLKRSGTDEAGVDEPETIEYLRPHTEETDLGGEIERWRGDLVRRVAAADRDANREIYDALESE